MLKYLLFFLMISQTLKAKDYKLGEDTVVFSGRVSKMNRVARLVRIRIKFENSKFLTKSSKVEVWNPSVTDKKCTGFLEGRSNDYFLLRIPRYDECMRSVYFTVGSYLHMYSPDLEKNLTTAKELVSILNRKRTALSARLKRYKQEVDSYLEKLDVVNKRYEILRQKLEIEWQKELSNLEEDKTKSYKNYKETQARLHDLDYKLQQYRVRDQNMIEDRWSLDPKLYYKK